MKVKTSVTLEADVLHRIDDVLAESETRSTFFQTAVIQLAEKRERNKRDAKDLAILNQSTELNTEVLEDLSLVAEVFTEQDLEQL